MRTVAGALLLPNGNAMANAVLRFTALRNEPDSVVRNSVSETTCDVTGAYSVDLLAGVYRVVCTYDASTIRLGDVVVTDGGPVELNDLFGENDPTGATVADLMSQLSAVYGGLNAVQQAVSDVQSAAGAAEDSEQEASDQAGLAVASAQVAVEQAGIATTKAGESADSAGLSEQHKNKAEEWATKTDGEVELGEVSAKQSALDAAQIKSEANQIKSETQQLHDDAASYVASLDQHQAALVVMAANQVELHTLFLEQHAV